MLETLRGLLLAVVLFVTACGGTSAGDPTCDEWGQWAQRADHRGAPCVAGQPMARTIASVTIDPLVDEERADLGGPLGVHYQSPLAVGDDVYMMSKSGTYTPCAMVATLRLCDPHRRDTMVWSEKGFRWENGSLVEKWSYESDWKPMPSTGGFEPMFQPAVAGDFIYVPGAGGVLHKLTRADGVPAGDVTPLPVDPDRYVTGPITVGPDGSLYYNSVRLGHADPFGTSPDAALVRVRPDGTTQTASYASLVPDAPAPDASCRGSFSSMTTPLPWPPPDDANGPVLPPTTFPCLAQRPPWNLAPALAPDGTIYTVSRAHASDRDAFVVAVNPDLTPKWTRSLQRIFDDGCGGPYLPIDGDARHLLDCRIGARPGVDPATNELPSGRASDQSTSSPVVLPDGAILYGAFTSYNISRGHLIKMSPAGAIVASFDFGWDVTPAVWPHDGTYSVIIKDNHYTEDAAGVDAGPYFIRQLDANLASEWAFESTNTTSCTTGTSGEKTCSDDHPHGFEWCVNAPAVDRDGTVYVNSEDGNLYAIGQGGAATVTKTLFLGAALGAAYTPVVVDGAGRILALNFGELLVVGP